MDVSFRQIKAFIEVSRLGSFSKAANAVHVSQPALSLMIQKMESQLGTQLFERTSRHVALTTAGRELLPGVQRLLGELEHTFSTLKESTLPVGGIVAVASIPSVSASILPYVIAEFEKERPRVQVVLHDAMTESRRMLQMLRAGEFDFAVGTPSEQDADLEFTPWFEDEYFAVIPLRHRLAKRRSVKWIELANEQIIATSYNSQVRKMMDTAFAGHGISVRPRAEVSLIATAMGMVEAGLGIAILPGTALRNLRPERVSVIRLVQPTVTRRLGFVSRSQLSLQPLARELIAFCLKADVPIRKAA